MDEEYDYWVTAIRTYRFLWGKTNFKSLLKPKANVKKSSKMFRRMEIAMEVYYELRMKVMKKPYIVFGDYTPAQSATKQEEMRFRKMKRRADKKAKAHKKYAQRCGLVESGGEDGVQYRRVKWGIKY